jgi:hypothetical protein
MALQRISKISVLSLIALMTLVLSALICSPVQAQVAGATVSGSIMDTSGSTIANVDIVLRNVETGVTRTVTSDASGFYEAPNLLPGSYNVSASAPGFSTAITTGVVLTVGAKLLLNLTMQVGHVTEKVVVSADALTVDLGTSSLGAVINSTTITELPLNGRDWTALATLEPGVVSGASLQPNVTAGFDRGNRGYGTQLIINGARPQQNSYLLDGININDYVGGGPGSVNGAALGVDSIGEFSVLTSNYSTEYGRASGGVINAITRSGTNQFHGTGFEFVRNAALDARNFFDGPQIAPFTRNQFGGSAGGPIIKDRLFIFGNYEGLRQSLGTSNVVNVFSPDARNGIIHNADGTVTNVTVDPLVQPFLALWPLPNGPLLGTGNTGTFSFAGSEVTNENFGTARVDFKISEKDSLFGSWQTDRSSLILPDSLNDSLLGDSTAREFFALEETHIFNSQMLNSARIGLNRFAETNSNGIRALNPAAADLTLSAVPGFPAPMISVTGLTSFGGGVAPSSNSLSSSRITLNAFQGFDDIVLTKGVQSLKFGFAVERDQVNKFSLSRPGGQFIYGSIADFLTNATGISFAAQVPTTTTPRDLRQTIYAGYVQDDVRWRPNLTFNLGMRYEMSTVPTETANRLAALQNVASPIPHIGNPLFSNPTYRNFEPRVGFAWDPFRTGKTSVRGGFGIFDVLPLINQIQSAVGTSFPFFQGVSATNIAPGSFPTEAFENALAFPVNSTSFIQADPKRNYVMQWNLSVQREVVRNLVATVAYVGSHGLHSPFHADDYNIVLPTLTPSGYLWPFPQGSGIPINPGVGRTDAQFWDSDSTYEGLHVDVQKSMSHGFRIQGSYTWSKSIDEGSAQVISDPFQNSITSLFWFAPGLRRSLSDFNIGQSLSINYIWDIPSPASLQGVAEWAARGWQFGGIVTIQSGLPFTPLIGGDPLGLNSTDPFAYPNRIKGPGCGSGVNSGNVNYINLNCFALPTAPASLAAVCTPYATTPGTCMQLLGNSRRNELIGPGLVDFDFALFKNNYIKRISESFDVQFRAEFFNAFNRSNFFPPIDNSTLFDQTGAPVGGAGAIDKTATTNREIQLGIKIIW